jgi:hypothetical protein
MSDIIGDMSLFWRLSLALVAAASMLFPGCKTRKRVEPVTVRIFSDLVSPYGAALDHRILEFQASNPRLSNGTAVQVGSLSIAELQSALKNMDEPGADIIILGSSSEALSYPALAPEMTHAVNVCAGVQACPAEIPAVIPSKLQGERAEAANQFVQFLTNTKPAPVASNPEPAPAQPAPTQANH